VERSREDVLRGLAGSLRSAARITGGIDKGAEHARSGKDAEERGDLLAATNAYRLAISLNDSPEMQANYTRVKNQLAVDLADKYKKQAKYEEDHHKWGAAALSWKKVSEGRPGSVEPLCRAADAILRAGGDLKHARDLAQNAVHLMPTNPKCRVTLARVYIGAGMQKSALGELQEAAKLDPSDQIVKTLLRDLA
jgi:predicted Zn-dependent protease